MAVKSLLAHRLRTLLTTLGVSIGVGTLLAIIGIIVGLNAAFSDDLAVMGTNTLWIQKFPWTTPEWWLYRNRKDLTLSQIELVRSQAKFLSAIAPNVNFSADVQYLDQSVSRVWVIGSTEDYPIAAGHDISLGRGISQGDDDNARPVAVLGMDVVDGLFHGVNPLGTSVKIGGRPFEVVGLFQRKGSLKVLGQRPDLKIEIPIHAFMGAFGRARRLSAVASAVDTEHLPAAMDELSGLLRRARKTPPKSEDDFSLNRSEQLAKMWKKLTGALYGVVVAVGVITLLVGGIGIMNIMLVSVRERTREIGVRRALGARKRTIVMQFLMEAATVSAVGGAVGTTLGLSIAKVIALVSPLKASVSPLAVLGGVGFAAMMGLVFGIWPAARAANLDPVEALRYE